MAQSQSRLAYLMLESLIVTLRLMPGSVVTEKQLIALAGFGRTPVREAVQRLEWQGLMEVRPRVGLQISVLAPADYAMILETRMQLEPLAARLMAANVSPLSRQTLIDCAKAMTECSVTEDREGFVVADRVFGDIMEESCRNRFIAQALRPLQTQSRRHWFAGATQRSLERCVEIHLRVIRALLQGDGPEAETQMTSLITSLITDNKAVTMQ